MVKGYNICNTCEHIPLYCRCGPAPKAGPDGMAVVGAMAGKSALFELAAMLNDAGEEIYAAVLRANLSIALGAAREEGYEVGYDAAKESVGEWLERLEP